MTRRILTPTCEFKIENVVDLHDSKRHTLPSRLDLPVQCSFFVSLATESEYGAPETPRFVEGKKKRPKRFSLFKRARREKTRPEQEKANDQDNYSSTEPASSFNESINDSTVSLPCLAEPTWVVAFNYRKELSWIVFSQNTAHVIERTEKVTFDFVVASHDINLHSSTLNSIHIAVGLTNGDVLVGNLGTKTFTSIFKEKEGFHAPIKRVMWLPGSSRLLLIATAFGEIVLWDLDRSALVSKQHEEGAAGEPKGEPLPSHHTQPAPQSSPHARNACKVWRNKSRKTNPVFRLTHEVRIHDVSLSHSGRLLAVCCDDGFLRVFDLYAPSSSLHAVPLPAPFPAASPPNPHAHPRAHLHSHGSLPTSIENPFVTPALQPTAAVSLDASQEPLPTAAPPLSVAVRPAHPPGAEEIVPVAVATADEPETGVSPKLSEEVQNEAVSCELSPLAAKDPERQEEVKDERENGEKEREREKSSRAGSVSTTAQEVASLAPHLVAVFASYCGAFLCATWSPDDYYIVTGGQDDVVSVFCVPFPAIVARGLLHRSWVSSITFDRREYDEQTKTHRLFTAAQDSQLAAWDFALTSLNRPRARTRTRKKKGVLSSSFAASVSHPHPPLVGPLLVTASLADVLLPPLSGYAFPTAQPLPPLPPTATATTTTAPAHATSFSSSSSSSHPSSETLTLVDLQRDQSSHPTADTTSTSATTLTAATSTPAESAGPPAMVDSLAEKLVPKLNSVASLHMDFPVSWCCVADDFFFICTYAGKLSIFRRPPKTVTYSAHDTSENPPRTRALSTAFAGPKPVPQGDEAEHKA